ncbi:hypothetical protein KUL10_30690 [Glaciecola sp. KUL10]|nr:hypothetical protein KUL10_30690 [Glaciecola sp. KUL10]
MFPSKESRDFYEYLKIFKRFASIHFGSRDIQACAYASELDDTECFRQDCKSSTLSGPFGSLFN